MQNIRIYNTVNKTVNRVLVAYHRQKLRTVTSHLHNHPDHSLIVIDQKNIKYT